MTAMDLARVVCSELINSGVREFVLAPGSRNAPFGFALVEAERRGEVRLHVRIDERDAGFTALGLAVGAQAPVAVVTTSGTAVANLHPAVLEAAHAGRPLIVLSADRPGVLIGSGANQTTDQSVIFGPVLRDWWQLSSDDDRPGHWRSAVRRSVAAATGIRSRQPGPVQLNIALAAPLVPGPDDQDVPAGRPFVVQPTEPAAPTPVSLDRPTVVLAGDASSTTGERANAFAQAAGLPLLAEPSSNARFGQALTNYRLLLPMFGPQIRQVICFGHPTLSRDVQNLLARSDLELIMVSATADWIDPGLSVDQVVDQVTASDKGDEDWRERWHQADERVGAAIADLVGEVSGPAVARRFWATMCSDEVIERGDLVVVGSSQLVRDLDLAPVSPRAPGVHANRGLSGIDGMISTALGVGLGARKTVQVLLGDLTFLHDLNGLLIGPDEPRGSSRFLVVNDNGGAIFSTLEQGAPDFADTFERVFGTPHGADLGSLVRGYGASHRRVDDLDTLEAILRSEPEGIEVVEIVIDRFGRRELDRRFREAAQAVVASTD